MERFPASVERPADSEAIEKAAKLMDLADEVGDIIDDEYRERLAAGRLTPAEISDLASSIRSKVFHGACDALGIEKAARDKAIDGELG